MAKYIEKQIGNFKMRIKSKEGGIHSTLRKMNSKSQEREPEFLYILRKEIKEGMTIVDLGANIGYLSLLMSDMIEGKGNIYSIEPDPENYDILCYNVQQLNNLENIISCYPLAISDINGCIKFYPGKASNLGSISKSKNSKRSIDVKTMTLNEFFKDKEKLPDLIKMDIEGSEVEVLRGAFDLFENNKKECKIAMEVHPTYYTKERSLEKELKKYLNIGFKTKYVISAAVAIPDKFRELGYIEPIKIFKSSGHIRGVYDKFRNDDMILVASNQFKQLTNDKKRYSKKIVRYIMIER